MDTGKCITWCACLLSQLLLGTHAPTHGGMAQAQLIWVPGSVPRWFTSPKTVTHAGTNGSWHRVTTLIETNALPLSQTNNNHGRKRGLTMQNKIQMVLRWHNL